MAIEIVEGRVLARGNILYSAKITGISSGYSMRHYSSQRLLRSDRSDVFTHYVRTPAQYTFLARLHGPDPLRLPPAPLCGLTPVPHNSGSRPVPRHSEGSGESIRPSARHRGDGCASSPSLISDPVCQSDARHAPRQYSAPLSRPDEQLPD